MRARPIIENLWSIHEALRRLGFKPEEIFVAPHENGIVYAVLKAQGKEFTITVGDMEAPIPEFCEEWASFAEAANSGAVTALEMQVIWDSSEVRWEAVSLVAGLINKGFKLRGDLN